MKQTGGATMNLDAVDLNEAKYKAMEAAKTPAQRMLAHDAGNVAMMVVLSEYGMVRMLNKFKRGVN